MVFHCGKLLLHQHDGYTVPCGGGGGEGVAAAIPPPPTFEPPLARDIHLPFSPLQQHDDKIRFHLPPLLVVVVVVGILVTVVFICIISTLRIRRERAHNNHVRRNGPILFHVSRNPPVSASDYNDGEGPTTAVEHPIWFIRTVGLNQSMIDSIAEFKYRKDEGLIDGTECSVCLGEFQELERLRLLPKCNHAFHVPCIDTWLASHQNCPLCRAPVVGSDARATVPDHSNASGENENQLETTQVENFDYGGEGSESGASVAEGEEEERVQNSISVDSSSAEEGEESSDTELGDKMEGSRSKIVKIDDKQGSISKLASIGSALHKRPIFVPFRRAFSSINNSSPPL